MEHQRDRPPEDDSGPVAEPVQFDDDHEEDDDDVDWGLAWLEQCERGAGYL